MKNKILIQLFFFAIYFVFTSCSKDWFDIKANKNQTIPTTLEDLELLLDDYVTVSTNTPGLIEVSADGHHILESSLVIFREDIPEYNNNLNAYTWTYMRPYQIVSDWNLGYKKIFLCNLVLSNIDKITRGPFNSEQYDRVKGNALFIKAKTYLELAQLYAEPYKAGVDSDFGLLLKNGIDITEKNSRSSVVETYTSIENMLKSALLLLPNRPSISTRASKNSCFALLSRFYLITENYSQCSKYSDSALSIDNRLLDYNLLNPNANNIGIFNAEIIFHSVMSNYALLSINYSFVDTSLFNTYEPNDLRKTIFYKQVDSGYIFKGNYSNNNTLFSGLATDEIMLNRAEANARQNKLQVAIADVNTLLYSRFKKDQNGNSTYIPKSPTSQSETIKIIINERRKELFKRGIRWSDIRRLKTDPANTTTIERNIGGQIYKLDQKYKYTLPIPDDEISISNILPNPGWKK